MLIKYSALRAQLQKKPPAIYIVTGQDPYLFNESVHLIKQAWRAQGACDESTWSVSSKDDWSTVVYEANAYSLLADTLLLDVSYDQKTIDSAAKTCLTQYSQNPNPRSLILIRAAHVPSKQWQWLTQDPAIMVIQAIPLTPAAFRQWLLSECQQRGFQFEHGTQDLIMQYTQGNLLACAQLIEKLALTHAPGTCLTPAYIMEHLYDQCEYQLYELSDACLTANATKAIHLLRHAYQNKTEATLILWLLTQEVTQLIQLATLLNQAMSFASACQKLKIWSQRIPAYQRALLRLPLPRLYQLLLRCQGLDEAIKSNQSLPIWQGLEQLALDLALSNPL